MIRLALINPPQPYLLEHFTQVPLGLLYLSAIVKRDYRENAKVVLLDCSAMSVAEAIDSVEEFDVFGFTATSLDYPAALDVMKGLRARFPCSRMILGGTHATVAPGSAVRDGFDSVFMGEGEQTIIQYLRDFAAGRERPLYKPTSGLDLDTLPWPDRDAFPWIGGNVLKTQPDEKTSINLMASRGCSCACAFCASETIWNRRVRWRSVRSVVDEIENCMTRYGIRVFRFSDDNLVTSKRWTREFCELVKPLGIKWRLSIRVDHVNADLLRTMADAGCIEPGFGVESFDPAVLRALGKGITPEQSIDAIRMSHDAGMDARLLMMVSTPGETYRHTVDANIRALDELEGQFCYLSVKIFKPLPGTRIWKNPKQFGITIESRDLRKYNFYAYRRGADDAEERSSWSPILIHGMTVEQQTENINRMLDYSEQFGEQSDG